jgi:hypothetical protein
MRGHSPVRLNERRQLVSGDQVLAQGVTPGTLLRGHDREVAEYMTRKAAVGLGCAALLVLAGCTNGQSVPKQTPHVTASETTACHDFAKAFVKNAATLGTSQVQSVASELKRSSSARLRSEGTALDNDITKGDNSALRADASKVAATCFNLGLTDKSGNPT